VKRDAMTNSGRAPDDLTDEQVPMCPTIMSRGFSGAQDGKVQIGGTVVVFAHATVDGSDREHDQRVSQ
jgi:alcohol dehydrogenase